MIAPQIIATICGSTFFSNLDNRFLTNSTAIVVNPPKAMSKTPKTPTVIMTSPFINLLNYLPGHLGYNSQRSHLYICAHFHTLLSKYKIHCEH